MSNRNDDASLEGMVGKPFRSHVDTHPTTPLADVQQTVELGDLTATSAQDAQVSPFADVPPLEAAAVAPEATPADEPAPAFEPLAASEPAPQATLPYDSAAFAEVAGPNAQPAPAPQQAPFAPYAPSTGAQTFGTPAYTDPAYGAPQPGALVPAPSGGQGGYVPPQAPPYQGGYAASAPAQSSGMNQMGLWSLIMAGIAVFGSMIPVLNWFSWLAPFAGVVLGIIGVTGQQYRNNRGLAIAGLIANGVLIVIVPIVLFLMMFAGLAFFGMFIPFLALGS
ncbi:hypothetical protein EG850_07735 [Gulosibacter macacae]|uniref:DUF4190 domain-containing protein n=1 Tax=Gulosibacter macacae TaxID=2488791 RepID=A0A3P3W0X6_9MICO|nr:hypothetical protein [Gulosibacter macacae]RRJ86533.1 hypothetical protein EG850_07735 [Gulosibacter macacae]